MNSVISDGSRMQSGVTVSSKKTVSLIKMEILNRNFTGAGGRIQNNLQLLLAFFYSKALYEHPLTECISITPEPSKHFCLLRIF